MMTTRQEKELKEKGYKIYKSGLDSKYEANEIAKRLKSEGSNARVGEYSTSVKGYHTFAVWYRVNK